jgi:hypothetical protein
MHFVIHVTARIVFSVRYLGGSFPRPQFAFLRKPSGSLPYILVINVLTDRSPCILQR